MNGHKHVVLRFMKTLKMLKLADSADLQEVFWKWMDDN